MSLILFAFVAVTYKKKRILPILARTKSKQYVTQGDLNNLLVFSCKKPPPVTLLNALFITMDNIFLHLFHPLCYQVTQTFCLHL